MRVAVMGARGRMGSLVCSTVEAEPDLELVAAVDQTDPLQELVDRRVEVAVDFTTPESVKDNVRFCIDNGIDVLVGTTGLTADDLADISSRLEGTAVRVLVVPNFAVGAVLMMRFAAQAATYFESAEIVERHHAQKLDAPSGTALRTADMMNEARGARWNAAAGGAADVSRGHDAAGIRIHSVRAAGSVAHQDVILGAPGETLTLRHDATDRSCFMGGVVLAIKRIETVSGLEVGLERVLGL